MTTKEIWKPVVGYEGIYKASSLGRIRSLNRSDRNGRKYIGKIINQYLGKDGYMIVSLCMNGTQQTKRVHRLCACAFFGDSNLVVDHIDSNRSNNEIKNLEFVTCRENVTRGRLMLDSKTTVGVAKRGNRFVASCSTGGRSKKIGTFDTIDEARDAYNLAVERGNDYVRKIFIKPKGKSYPSGVHVNGDKFSSKININRKTIHLGVFDNPEDAHEAHLYAKKFGADMARDIFLTKKKEYKYGS